MLGEFEILDLVGEGGFGIVYLAQDHSLHRKVALKEYMPALLASRGKDASVAVRSERQRETFDIGLRSFVNEARMLAQFDHPALIKVFRFWEANGTAYMVMPFLSGQTLQDALKQRGEAPAEAWIRALLSPLMDALAVLHEDKVYHRDIAPDNIMLLAGDRPVLLDFGAARRVISDMTHALTVILKPGYAPIEQYADMPGMKQGPWTDVYALAAVVYFMILKRKPPAAVGRLMEDSYEPLMQSEAAGRYSAAVAAGHRPLPRVRAEDRPQSMAAMREAIGLDTMPVAARRRSPPQPPPPETGPAARHRPSRPAAPAPNRRPRRRPRPAEPRAESTSGRLLRDRLRGALSAAGAGAQQQADARRHRRAGRAGARGRLAYFASQRRRPRRRRTSPVAAAPAVKAPAASAVVAAAPPAAPRIASLDRRHRCRARRRGPAPVRDAGSAGRRRGRRRPDALGAQQVGRPALSLRLGPGRPTGSIA